MEDVDKPDQSRKLQITRDTSKSEVRQMTESVFDPAATSACTAANFSQFCWGVVDVTESVAILKEKATQVHGGDLREMETTLVAQTAALDSIFAEMARRSLLNLGENIDRAERYMRLALKAQSQCRSNIEALAVLKNPPVFARQANINNGGQQQVNNGTLPPEVFRHSSTHAHDHKSTHNKLLEKSNGQWLDTRAKGKAGRGHQTLEAVGEVNRA